MIEEDAKYLEIRFRQRIRAILAIMIVGTTCIMAGFGKVNAEAMIALAGAAIGFFFKSKTTE